MCVLIASHLQVGVPCAGPGCPPQTVVMTQGHPAQSHASLRRGQTACQDIGSSPMLIITRFHPNEAGSRERSLLRGLFLGILCLLGPSDPSNGEATLGLPLQTA